MDETPIPNPPLSATERAPLARLSSADLEAIDSAVLSCAQGRWRKVAIVVGLCMESLGKRYRGFLDVFYAERVRALVDSGKLESQGNLAYMRFSEVRQVDATWRQLQRTVMDMTRYMRQRAATELRRSAS